MKRLMTILVTMVMASAGILNAHAAADLADDPSSVMRAMQPTALSRGILFVENMDSLFALGYIKYTDSPEKNSAGALLTAEERDWKLCSSWRDDACVKRYKSTVDGYVILGSCISSKEIGCVESLSVSDSSGQVKELALVGPATSNVIDIPESQEYGIPRSTSRPLYRDSSGQLYIVRASLRVNFPPGSDAKTFFNLSVDVLPVTKVANSDIDAPEAISLPNNVTGKGIVTVRPTREECVTIDKGYCYQPLVADVTSEYQLKLRVPTGVSGWMNGRLVEPRFTLTQINSNSQVISVSAKPARMPIAGGWASYAELPENFLANLYPYSRLIFEKKMPGFFVSSPSQGDRGFQEYAAWAPYLKDKAITSVTNWSFSTQVNTGVDFCGKSTNEITGVVSSNASVYSSRPPTWDAANSTLSYQVASPHNDENGKENLGTYTLAMSLKAIQCLYGQSSLPPSATISIGYGKDVVTVATVTLKSDSGWIYFNASGFHYSSPTITVKFAKTATQSTSRPQSPQSAAPPISQAAPGIKTQWCAKGNAKKKVVGVNPTCPKGYKKIADPFAR
jgi:hypothetical protein